MGQFFFLSKNHLLKFINMTNINRRPPPIDVEAPEQSTFFFVMAEMARRERFKLSASLDADEQLAINEDLYAAADKGDLNLVSEALKRNAEVDYVIPFWGHSVLHRAVFKQHYQIVELLLFAGANAEIKSSDKSTPLHLAASNLDAKMIS